MGKEKFGTCGTFLGPLWPVLWNSFSPKLYGRVVFIARANPFARTVAIGSRSQRVPQLANSKNHEIGSAVMEICFFLRFEWVNRRIIRSSFACGL